MPKILLLLLGITFYLCGLSNVFADTSDDQITSFLDKLTPSEESILEKKLTAQKKIENNPFSIGLYNPSYILPVYYTASPDYAVYQNNTPNNQKVMRTEFKSQISVFVPVLTNVFSPKNNIDIAYTQLNYWQVYASSQYFRETNYKPELFFESNFHKNWLFRVGFNHESNGRGGEYERSWNRAFSTVQVSGSDWLVGVTAWTLLFQGESSNYDNPDIAHYLGYESVLLSHKIYDATFSVQLQNLESGLSRGFVETTLSYPISKHISIYAQYFNGYGQSLIEYNHRTQGAGIGIALNDWI